MNSISIKKLFDLLTIKNLTPEYLLKGIEQAKTKMSFKEDIELQLMEHYEKLTLEKAIARAQENQKVKKIKI